MNLIQKQFIRMIIPVMMIYSLSEWCSAYLLTFYCGIVFHAFIYLQILQKFWNNRRYISVNVTVCGLHYIFAVVIGVVFCAAIKENNISIAVAFVVVVYTNIYFCKGEHTAQIDIENDMRELTEENIIPRLIIIDIACILNFVYILTFDEEYHTISMLVAVFIGLPMKKYALRLFLIYKWSDNADIDRQKLKENYIYWAIFIHKFEHMIFDFFKTNLFFYLVMVQFRGKGTFQEPTTLCCDSDSINILNTYAENIQTVQRANLINYLMVPYSQLGLLFICAKQEIVYFMSMYKVLYLLLISKFHTIWRFLIYVIIRIMFILLFVFLVCYLVYIVHQNTDSAGQSIVINRKDFNFSQRRLSIKESGKTIITRFLGEDVELDCSVHVDVQNEQTLLLDWMQFKTLRNHVYWKHNGTIIDSSISDRVELVDYGNSLYDLRIKHLEESDLGVYECHIDVVQTYYLQVQDFQNFTINETFNIKQYVLKAIPREIKSFFVQRGKILTFQISLNLFTFEDGDIIINYNVNSIDIFDICINDFMSCSPTAYLSKHFLEGFSSERLIVEQRKGYLSIIVDIQIQSCVCGNMYGNHEITYYREYYNRSSGKTQLIGSIYPFKLMFFPSDNDSIINEDMLENYPGSKLFRFLGETDEIKIPFIFASEIRVNCFALGIYIFNLFICVVLWALQKVVSLYCRFTITPVTNMFLLGNVRLSQLKITQRNILEIEDSEHDPQYDVYISCCTEDNDFAEGNVLKYVEENLTLTACFPERDLAHQAGIEVFHLYAKATRLSKKFIVVLSKQYVNNDECNKLQLLRCILPLLREPVRNQQDLLIIKLDNVAIPEQIKWDPYITIVDYSVIDDYQNLKHKLSTFLRK